ncbi:MAG: urease accessory protein UreD [Desulfovibrio sp.]|jgi:urease accessory protein|nr:urease accessory protein UreD [Desulfovibrio sp.]
MLQSKAHNAPAPGGRPSCGQKRISPPDMEPDSHSFTAARRWGARMDCTFSAASDGRTVLSRMRFSGPLRVQRLFYPEKERADGAALPCHCCLLHPPGGLVSGDSLDIRYTVQPGAHCLLTTPAAGKIYGADARLVPQRQHCSARLEGGVLEYLPLENIIFNGALAHLHTDFFLKGPCRLLAWDISCLGRRAGNEPFEKGRLVQRTRIFQDGLPLFHERLDLEGGSGLRANPAGLNGASVFASFYACGRAGDERALRAACEGIRDRFGPAALPRGQSGVSCRNALLTARYLGQDGAEAARFCLEAWNITRPLLPGLAARAPRVWNN